MTQEERIKQLEATIKHMRRKLHKTVVGIIPPTLVSNFVQEPMPNGLVMTAAFPGGKITKALVVIKEMPKEGIELRLTNVRQTGLLSRSMTTKRKVEVIDLDLELSQGEVAELYVTGEAKGIWVTFLWEAEMSDRLIKQVMLSELEELEELEDEGV
ncbi:MAG: hypothetical protein KKH70_20420 [Gammaproteobacteria bacterium]|nr:hypothetical protein [Gammaproteobacteria bacterium]